MERLCEIMDDLDLEVDYRGCTRLIDDKVLSSLAIMTLVMGIEDEFDVVVKPKDLTPDNFNSLDSIWNLINKYLND